MPLSQVPALCLACDHVFEGDSRQCSQCGGVRITRHAELFDLEIAHLDCDAFYAAIEKRDNPALVDKPVIVGGGVRGVVSTACYVARTYGVKSAMPMFKALNACPDAVVIKPDMAKYAAVGRAIRDMMLALTPIVEPISIDEAFLDLSGTRRLHGAPPAVTMARLQRRIEAELGVTASVGLSHNKFLAKIASDFDKPLGFSVIGRAETVTFLAALPVRAIWGVGKAAAKKLESDGISTVGQLQKMEEGVLAKRYGELGLRLARLSRGDDRRSVKPVRETKSLSSETTFDRDISDPGYLEDVLWELCEKVSARMKAAGFAGRVVTFKLKSADFKTSTRRKSLGAPTNLARVLFDVAKGLLRETAPGGSWRLIGVGFSTLSPETGAATSDLFNADLERIAAQEGAVDAIRSKFGKDAIGAGRTLRQRGRKN
ncbi:MAG: DNA polymerase IV [Pseudomonadota bacterium]